MVRRNVPTVIGHPRFVRSAPVCIALDIATPASADSDACTTRNCFGPCPSDHDEEYRGGGGFLMSVELSLVARARFLGVVFGKGGGEEVFDGYTNAEKEQRARERSRRAAGAKWALRAPNESITPDPTFYSSRETSAYRSVRLYPSRVVGAKIATRMICLISGLAAIAIPREGHTSSLSGRTISRCV